MGTLLLPSYRGSCSSSSADDKAALLHTSVSMHSLLGFLSPMEASVSVGMGTVIAPGSYCYGSQMRLKRIRCCTWLWVSPPLCSAVFHPILSLRLQLSWTCGSCVISIEEGIHVGLKVKMNNSKTNLNS